MYKQLVCTYQRFAFLIIYKTAYVHVLVWFWATSKARKNSFFLFLNAQLMYKGQFPFNKLDFVNIISFSCLVETWKCTQVVHCLCWAYFQMGILGIFMHCIIWSVVLKQIFLFINGCFNWVKLCQLFNTILCLIPLTLCIYSKVNKDEI